MTWTLVTGGAKRLGAEICKMLALHGYHLVVHYNTSEKEALEVIEACHHAGVYAEAIQGDFSSVESTEIFVKKYLERFPDTSNLINNVGNYLIASPLETSIKEWGDLFQTNLQTPIALIRALIPSIQQFRGNIINIGVAGMEMHRSSTYATAYYLTKVSLLSLTRALARELAPSLVRVNMISPGYLENAVNLPKDITTLPMRRPGTCKEVARVIAFLMDQENAYITGQNIEVAGAVGL